MSTRRDGSILALGSAVAGLLSYAIFALTTRTLGSATAAPVTVLWTSWAFAAAALTFPVQHWVTRAVSVHGEDAVRRTLPVLAAGMVVVAAAATAVAALLRGPLFGRSDAWFPVLVGAVSLGSALVGVTRGMLAAQDRLVALAASLVAENALRCLAVAALVVAGSDSPVAYGLALVGGHAVVVLWPGTLRVRGWGSRPQATPFAFLAGAGSAQLTNQVVLTGGPVLLAIIGGGAAEVTGLFAALALFRAPYMVALGVMPQVTARVTALTLQGRTHRVDRGRRMLGLGTGITVPAATAGAWWLGPPVLAAVFGDDVRPGSGVAALVAAGSTLAVANLVLLVMAMAQGRATRSARAWGGAVVGGAVAYALLSGLSPAPRVAAVFLVAEAVAFVGLLLAARPPRGDGTAGGFG